MHSGRMKIIFSYRQIMLDGDCDNLQARVTALVVKHLCNFHGFRNNA